MYPVGMGEACDSVVRRRFAGRSLSSVVVLADGGKVVDGAELDDRICGKDIGAIDEG